MTVPAVSRRRWLSELAQTLDRAGRLTAQLADQDRAAGEIALLRARIADLRMEVELLRRGGPDWPHLECDDWASDR